MENANEEKLKEKKGNKKIMIIIAIGTIVALVIVGIVMYAGIWKNNDAQSAKKENVLRNNEIEKEYDVFSGMQQVNPWYNEGVKKPIIYLYPKKAMEVSVKLGKPENITCSYPEYNNGWNVIANPDGTLIDMNTGRNLYSLYWEGIHSNPINAIEGFVVKGSETIDFLEEKLAILGLNEFEAEEFIVYWLPKLQENEYNFVRFATMDEISKNMPLEFSVEPDTIIRVLMEYKALDKYTDVVEQKLETPDRTGFVAVEWGGTEIK